MRVKALAKVWEAENRVNRKEQSQCIAARDTAKSDNVQNNFTAPQEAENGLKAIRNQKHQIAHYQLQRYRNCPEPYRFGIINGSDRTGSYRTVPNPTVPYRSRAVPVFHHTSPTPVT